MFMKGIPSRLLGIILIALPLTQWTSAGEKIRYVPATVPSWSIAPVKSSFRDGTLVRELTASGGKTSSTASEASSELMSLPMPMGGYTGEGNRGKSRNEDLNDNWIFAREEDYDSRNENDELNSMAGELGEFGEDSEGISYNDSMNKDSKDSSDTDLMSRFLSDESESQKKKQNLESEKEDSQETGRGDAQDSRNESPGSVSRFVNGDLNQKKTENGSGVQSDEDSRLNSNKSEWDRLFDSKNSRLTNGLNKKENTSEVSNVVSMLGGNYSAVESHYDKSVSDRTTTKVGAMLSTSNTSESKVSDGGLVRSFGSYADANSPAKDRTSQMPETSTFNSQGLEALSLNQNLQGFASSPNGGGISGLLNSSSGAVIGAASGSNLQEQPNPNPTYFRQPSVLSFPKRGF